jgi:siderophore synthetase component
MDKVLFFPRLQRERDKFELLINRVGFTRQLTMKGIAGGLSIKDLLADILTREQFIADRLSEIMHGEIYAPCVSHSALDAFQDKFGYPDYESPLMDKEQLNHLVIYKHKNIALDEIIAQELAAYANIISALERITENQCLDHDLFHRIAEHTYKPYHRLGLEIKHWLKSISPESK